MLNKETERNMLSDLWNDIAKCDEILEELKEEINKIAEE